ncbi:unnamed protein product [Lampetra planeri]
MIAVVTRCAFRIRRPSPLQRGSPLHRTPGRANVPVRPRGRAGGEKIKALSRPPLAGKDYERRSRARTRHDSPVERAVRWHRGGFPRCRLVSDRSPRLCRT